MWGAVESGSHSPCPSLTVTLGDGAYLRSDSESVDLENEGRVRSTYSTPGRCTCVGRGYLGCLWDVARPGGVDLSDRLGIIGLT